MRPRRFALLALALLGAASPAVAQRFDDSRFADNCRPPLKFVAGACVERCPAGYEDRGRSCEYRSMGGGGGGGP